jgi:hypothetical protein
MYKACTYCNKSKSLDDFHILKTGFLGRNSICKLCRKEKRKNIQSNSILTHYTCNSCKIKKSVEDFYKKKNSVLGIQSYCKICQKEVISKSKSKIDIFSKIILKKYKKKHKTHIFKITYEDIIRKYNEQNGKCFLTNHELTHYTDTKQRSDNIWNMAILCEKGIKEISYNSFSLVINLVYSIQGVYNLNNKQIIHFYKEIIDGENNNTI